MPSSAVPILTDQQPQLPSNNQSTKSVDSNVDADEEYEEIEEEVEVEEEVEEEIEEEVEVEEEFEVEEEEEKEIGGEFLPTHQNDVSQVVEFEGHGEHLSRGPASPGTPVANLPLTVPNIEDISGASKIPSPSETIQKEESHINVIAGKGIPKNLNGAECESKASPRGSGITNAEAKSYSISVEEMRAPTITGVDSGDKNSGALYFKEETKQNAKQSLEDINQMAPRSHLSQIRSRTVSPGAEVNSGNKRLALVCDFFAKGWCIKGKSCRFLHVRDHGDASDSTKGVTAASDKKSEFSTDEGLRDSSERSGLFSLPEVAAASCAKDPPKEDGQSARWSESMEYPSYRSSPRSFSFFKDVGRGSFVKTWYADEHGTYPFMNGSSPIYGNSSFHGTLSSSFVTLPDTSQNSRFPSHALGLEGVVSKGDQVMADGHTLPSSSTLLTAGMFPSSSTSSRSPLSFNRLRNNADPFGSQKWTDGEQGCHAFEAASRSSYFGCESSLSQNDISGDTSRSSGFKTKIVYDDWEPSVPFRPSFFITRSLSSPRSQYDPFRDSIEQPNIGPDHTSDKHSVTSHSNFNDSILTNNSFKKKLSPLTERATAIVTEWRDKVTLSEENKSFVSAQGKDVSKDDKVGVNYDSEFQIERSGNKIEFSRVRESSEMDVASGADVSVYKDSKILKQFRAALVDFVKELVKPTWRDGHLSKDAHKVIVKKTVDKVLGTLQAHQIPSTSELIKPYLSSAQPKIAKLLEVYIHKYGNC